MRIEDVNAKLAAKIPNIADLYSLFQAEHPTPNLDAWLDALLTQGLIDDSERIGLGQSQDAARVTSASLVGMTMTTEGMDDEDLDPNSEDSPSSTAPSGQAIAAPPVPPSGVRTAVPVGQRWPAQKVP